MGEAQAVIDRGEKLRRTSEVMDKVIVKRSRARCQDCHWHQYSPRSDEFFCRQPWVAEQDVDAHGKIKYRNIGAVTARNDANLCGPEADVFQAKSPKEVWGPRVRTTLDWAATIALVLGIGTLVVKGAMLLYHWGGGVAVFIVFLVISSLAAMISDS